MLRNDKNGIELRVGHVVRIEGGFFKNNNGIFRISHAPFNPDWNGTDYCMKKINKRDYSDSKSKYSINFYPLSTMVNDREKNRIAREHNKKNVTIEVIGQVKMFKVKQTHDRWKEIENILYLTESEYNVLDKEKDNTRTDFELLEVIIEDKK